MLYKKIAILNTVIVVSVIGVLIWWVLTVTNNLIYDESTNAYNFALETTNYQLNELISTAKSISLNVSIHPYVQSEMRRCRQSDTFLLNDEEVSALLNISQAQVTRHSDFKVQLIPISQDGTPYALDQETGRYAASLDLQERAWYREAFALAGGFSAELLHEYGGSFVRIAHVVYDMKDWNTILGLVAVDVNFNTISLLLSEIRLGESGKAYLYNQNGELQIPLSATQILSPDQFAEKVAMIVLPNENLALIKNVSQLKWWLVGIVKGTEILHQSKILRNNVFALSSILLFGAVLITVLLAYRLMRPLMILSRQMKYMSKETLAGPRETIKTSGEVKVLYDSYDQMLDMINDLMDQVYQAGIREKDAELKALQAQINPHFLYNTLDLINWMARDGKTDEVQRTVQVLSSMLRFSLNSEKEVTIAKELLQVENYILIQQERFPGLFVVEMDIDPAAKKEKIPKLILQPLVENAILHAFAEQDACCLLMIHALCRDRLVHVEIANDGSPADIAKINEILAGGGDKNHHGLRNVNERLRSYYGESGGLTCEITQGMTCFRFCVPMKLDSDDQ